MRIDRSIDLLITVGIPAPTHGSRDLMVNTHLMEKRSMTYPTCQTQGMTQDLMLMLFTKTNLDAFFRRHACVAVIDEEWLFVAGGYNPTNNPRNLVMIKPQE